MMMIKQFIEACMRTSEYFYSVIMCTGSSDRYSPLFFSTMMDVFKKKGVSVIFYSLQEMDLSDFEVAINTSFLGQSQLLWLGDISTLDVARQKRLETVLQGYRGPHTVCMYQSDKLVQKNTEQSKDLDHDFRRVFAMEPFLTVQEQIFLFTFFWESKPDDFLAFLRRLPEQTKITYEMFMILSRYSLVLGTKSDEFITDWYPKLMTSEQSLFTLANYFFSRKHALFYKLWFDLKDHYALSFWTVFWSEQVWRAYHVIDLRQKNMFNDAKIIGMRLPFSFLQKDWEYFTTEELLVAHDLLYSIDRQSKLGGALYGLDFFYSSFLNRRLSNKIQLLDNK